jgi:phosphoribosyl 1,2-cyclic phosphodiesterase
VRITFYGVRGSTPAAGPEFDRVGGHTSCVAVSDGEALPTLVLDAGTGLQSLFGRFGDAPFAGTILVTHLHWDHVQGIPFFPAADREDARVTLAQPAQGDPSEVLSRAMSPPHFPIGPNGLRGTWSHVALDAGKHTIEGYEVFARDVVHKGGRTFGFRVRRGDATFAYVPDALDDNDDAILELAADVDLFVRGAPFVSEESERANLFGHGTAEHAIEIAQRAGARRLLLTHHGPFRTDDAVAAIAQRLAVETAYEGLAVDL